MRTLTSLLLVCAVFAGTGMAQVVQWETNSAECSLDVDGLQVSSPTAASPAVTVGMAGTSVNVNFGSSLAGNIYDVVLTATSLIGPSGGAIVSANGQILNMNLAHPTLIFLQGGSVPFGNLATFPGNFTVPFTLTAAPCTISAQMAILNPANPDAYELSQGIEISLGCAVTQCPGANTGSTSTNNSAFKANVLSLSSPATLQDISLRLDNVSAGTNLEWFVYEDQAGTFNQIFSTTAPTAGGSGLFSSGAISVPLNAGTTYIIGGFWDQPVTYFFDNSGAQTLPQVYNYGFTTMTVTMRYGFGTAFPSPATVPGGGTPNSAYWQCYTLAP